MPVNVRVPIRLRVDAAALREREAQIDDAFSEAVSRALSASRAEVIAARGGYARVQTHSPTFRWTGVPVSGDLREGIEALLSERLTALIDAAGLYDFEAARANAPQPLEHEVAEIFDRSRYQPVIDLYEVMSYQGGEPTVIPVTISNDAADDAEGEVTQRRVWYPIQRRDNPQRPLDADNASDAVLLGAMASQVRREWGNPTEAQWGVIWFQVGGTFGIVFNIAGGGGRSFIVSTPTERVISGGRFTTRSSGLPAEMGSMQVRGRVTSDADAQRLAREIYASGIEQAIRSAARRDRTNTDEATYNEQLQEKVNAELRERVTQWRSQANGATEFLILELNVGGLPSYVVAPTSAEWSGTVTLYPVTRMEEQVALGERQERPDADRPAGTPLPTRPEDSPGAGGTGDGGDGGDGGTGGAGGQGGGARGGQRGGQPGGTGSGQGGGIIYTGQTTGGAGGSIYPHMPGTGTPIQCGDGFLGEPNVSALGRAGDALRQVIAEIAARLQIPPCDYAAQFCRIAAQAIASRATTVGDFAVTGQGETRGFTRPVEVDTANLGLLEFRPTASPSVQYMTYLSATVPKLDLLIRMVSAVYASDEHRGKISGTWANDPYGYLIQFLSEMTSALKSAVRGIFYATCRVLMMQLLRASRDAIHNRQRNFEAYAPIFERLVLTQLQPMATLRHLYDRLRDKLSDAGILETVGMAAFTTWQGAHHAVSDMFAGYSPFRESPADSDDDFVKIGSSYGIRDSTGTVWTLTQLQQALSMREGTTETIDPLVKQLADIPGMLDRFRRNPRAIREELRALLQEMSEANAEVIREVASDRIYAFRASKVQENIPSATVPGTSFALQGIHLQAHLMIHEFFEGSSTYTLGLDSAMKIEAGREHFITFTIFVGTTLLAVVCAPLAIAVGAAIAVYQRYQASEREEIFRALIDPDLVLTRAEVEAELFAAELGIALAFIPYAGRILRGGTTAVRTVAQQGVRGSARLASAYVRQGLTTAGARAATRAMRAHLTEEMERGLRNGLVMAIAQEAVQNLLLDQFLSRLLIGPAIEQLYREYQEFTPPSASADYMGRAIDRPPGGSQ